MSAILCTYYGGGHSRNDCPWPLGWSASGIDATQVGIWLARFVGVA